MRIAISILIGGILMLLFFGGSNISCGKVDGEANDPITFNPSISINGDTEYTTTNFVSLSLSADYAEEMIISEDFSFGDASWSPYATSIKFELSENEGPKTVYAKFRKNTHYESEVISDATILDTTAPEVIIECPFNNSILTEPLQGLTGKVDDLEISTAIIALNGSTSSLKVANGSFSATLTLSEGPNSLQVKITDKAGLSGKSEINITLDTLAPTITLTSPARGLTITSSESLPIIATVDDPEISSASLTLNGLPQTINVVAGLIYEYLTLTEGTNIINLTVIDAAGHQGSTGDIQIILDTTPPVLIIESPFNNAIFTESLQSLTGNVDDPEINTAIIALNGTTSSLKVANGSFSTTLTLSEGPNNLQVKATDKVGLSGESEINITLDTEAPTITLTSPAEGFTITSSESLTVNATVDDPVIESAILTLNGLPLIIDVVGGVINENENIPPLTEGINILNLTIVDGAGHYGSTGDIPIILDTTPPAVSITFPPNGSTFCAPARRITGVIDDAEFSSATLILNGEESIIEVSSGSFDQIVDSIEGVNTLQVYAIDRVGWQGWSEIVEININLDPYCGMVQVGSYWIDRYEASRADATHISMGNDSINPPQSVAGVIPWYSITWEEASAACQEAGKRLCTGDEFMDACDGVLGEGGSGFPYGDDYESTFCNGIDVNYWWAISTGTLSDCVSDFGAYDMSGNVREWSAEVTALGGDWGSSGGPSPEGGPPGYFLRCDFVDPIGVKHFECVDLGFRCCKD